MKTFFSFGRLGNVEVTGVLRRHQDILKNHSVLPAASHSTVMEHTTPILPPFFFFIRTHLLHECKIYNTVSLKGITTLRSK